MALYEMYVVAIVTCSLRPDSQSRGSDMYQLCALGNRLQVI